MWPPCRLTRKSIAGEAAARVAVERLGRQERIVLGREAERRRRDPRQEPERARRGGSSRRAPAKPWSGALAASSNSQKDRARRARGDVHLRRGLGKAAGGLDRLRLQRREKAADVEPARASSRGSARSRRGRTASTRAAAAATRRLRRVLAEPLQQHVAAERHADRGERASPARGAKRPDDEVEVARLARSGRAAAGDWAASGRGRCGSRAQERKFSAVPRQPAPGDLLQEPLDVDRIGAALQAVERAGRAGPRAPPPCGRGRARRRRASRGLPRRNATSRRPRASRPQTVWRWGPGSHQAGRKTSRHSMFSGTNRLRERTGRNLTPPIAVDSAVCHRGGCHEGFPAGSGALAAARRSGLAAASSAAARPGPRPLHGPRRIPQAPERPEGRALAGHDGARRPSSPSTTTSASASSRRTAPASPTCSST